MSEPTGHRPDPAPDAAGAGWIAFSLADQRFRLPMASVEAVDTPPPLTRVPHATSALLGAGNFAGRIVPVLDLGMLLDRPPGRRAYDGGGEILRLRTPAGNVGLWVDRVERLTHADAAAPTPHGAALLDPARLLATALTPADLAPSDFGDGTPAPLGDVADQVLPAATAATSEAFIIVEVAGRTFHLPHDTVVELVAALPWTQLPRAPAGLLGVGVLRGVALPVLSPPSSPARPGEGAPAGFVVIEIAGRRAALAVDRIVGLRSGDAPGALPSSDFGATISEEIRRIVQRFPAIANARPAAVATGAGPAVEYLAFTVAGQDFAVPIASIDRVIAAQPLIALPRPVSPQDDAASRIIGVIEVAGQMVPVATLGSWEAQHAATADGEPPVSAARSAYVILDGPDGRGAIGVDRIDRVVRLRLDELATPPAGHDWIEAIATRGNGEFLRIIATARLWSTVGSTVGSTP